MSYSVKEQLRRVRKLKSTLNATKTWSIAVDEDGREYPPDWRAQMKPGDRVIIRQYGVSLDRV